MKTILFFLVLTFQSAFAGGVLCANRCKLATDFQSCCLACEEACPNCVACSTRCPQTDSSPTCSGKPEGAICKTYGPHGGKMDGVCEYHSDVHYCGCRPVFTGPQSAP